MTLVLHELGAGLPAGIERGGTHRLRITVIASHAVTNAARQVLSHLEMTDISPALIQRYAPAASTTTGRRELAK